MENIIDEYFQHHKGIQAEDIYKFLYQGVYGAEHFIENVMEAENLLFDECYKIGVVDEKPSLPKIELISKKFCRINLIPYCYEKGDILSLFKVFNVGSKWKTQNREKELMHNFVKFAKLNESKTWVAPKKFKKVYRFIKKGQAIHHSKKYRDIVQKEQYELEINDETYDVYEKQIKQAVLSKPHYRVIPVKLLHCSPSGRNRDSETLDLYSSKLWEVWIQNQPFL